ncbi:type I-E CRISPR-associated protein Cas7/Cse4/CasC [Benzoatithermus flavus]|uniref:Type I-E CRISPR-associated protein Cas7/Cse4/CasC n=1 Tax=Benzoatithermus flavus TaxID=3108223 RepID=A0ABU8XMW8_9PROT
MTEPRFVQIHTLHSYPAALLNRDDAGLAKRLPFGGVTRTRISSQCLKRHWRMAEGKWALRELGLDAAKRSRRIFSHAVLATLVEEGFERSEARSLVETLRDRLLGNDKKGGATNGRDSLETEQALMLGVPEITYLTDIVRKILTGDEQLRQALLEKPKKKGQLTGFQKQLRSDLNDNLTVLLKTTKLPQGLESALFGRMVTSDLIANTDAAIHVAHAFTVHEEESESDYFTVVDDLKDRAEGDDAGSAGIFDTELTSGLYYGYVVVDVPGLVANLGGERALAGRVVEHLLHLIATVSPGAKLGSTAPYGWAQLMLVELGDRQPRSLANAFRDPVPLDRRGDTLPKALRQLAAHLAKLDAAYGVEEERRFLSVEDTELPRAERSSLDLLARRVAEAIAAGGSGQ